MLCEIPNKAHRDANKTRGHFWLTCACYTPSTSQSRLSIGLLICLAINISSYQMTPSREGRRPAKATRSKAWRDLEQPEHGALAPLRLSPDRHRMEHAPGRVSMKNGMRLIVLVVTPVLVGALSGMATARGVQEWSPEASRPGSICGRSLWRGWYGHRRPSRGPVARWP
jgi:hypothetical protein